MIPLLLLRGKAAEAFSAAIADEESTGDNIRNISGIRIPDGPVQGQTVDFSFFVADYADLFLERVIGFNVAAYGSLHGIQGSADFRNPGQLSPAEKGSP